ncbi:MAG: GGDEF domain-containing protein [Gaiellaceae bacterium]
MRCSRPGDEGWGTFAILFGLVLAADRPELYAGRFYDMRVATVPMVTAVLLLPAPLVMLCGAGFALHRLNATLQWRQRLFNGCSHALTGLAAWGVANALPGHDGSGIALAGAGIAATFIYAVSRWVLLVAILHFARDLALGKMKQQLPALLVAEGGLGALGIVIAALWVSDPVLVPFAILPLVLIWSALQLTALREEARVDVKTGLYNARHLRDSLASELERAGRYKRPLSLLLADLGFLREINNTYGHLAGDAVLEGIGEILRAQVRSTDIPARFGGEEFCVVLPETPGRRAHQLAERIGRAVEERAFDVGRGAASCARDDLDRGRGLPRRRDQRGEPDRGRRRGGRNRSVGTASVSRARPRPLSPSRPRTNSGGRG